MNLSFQPAAGRHAIDTCTVIARFAQPVDQETFTAISELAKQVASQNNLPAVQQVVFPPMLLNVIGGIVPNAGLICQRFASNGTVEAELKCEPMAITVQIRRYDGWTEFSSFLESTMLQLVPLYVSNLPAISAVSIQYDDRFVCNNGMHPAAGELFRLNTPWVAIYDRESNQPWHSHFGIFIAESDSSRELVNVNVTVNDLAAMDGNIKRTVGLTTLVSKSFDIPGMQPLIVEVSSAGDAVRELLTKAHDRSRHILEEVLTDPYLEAIGAKAKAG